MLLKVDMYNQYLEELKHTVGLWKRQHLIGVIKVWAKFSAEAVRWLVQSLIRSPTIKVQPHNTGASGCVGDCWIYWLNDSHQLGQSIRFEKFYSPVADLYSWVSTMVVYVATESNVALSVF